LAQAVAIALPGLVLLLFEPGKVKKIKTVPAAAFLDSI
jgi:hypothetical protein